jgi:hypothetical protein
MRLDWTMSYFKLITGNFGEASWRSAAPTRYQTPESSAKT